MYISKFPGSTPCQQHDPELWMSEYQDSAPTLRAKELCRQCPELSECLSSTISFELREGIIQHAVFGGLTRRDRAQLYLQMNAAQAAS